MVPYHSIWEHRQWDHQENKQNLPCWYVQSVAGTYLDLLFVRFVHRAEILFTPWNYKKNTVPLRAICVPPVYNEDISKSHLDISKSHLDISKSHLDISKGHLYIKEPLIYQKVYRATSVPAGLNFWAFCSSGCELTWRYKETICRNLPNICHFGKHS